MCLHNARRDDFLLQPLAIRQRANEIFWNPITGGLQNDPHPVQAPILPPKLRKGRDVLDTTAPTTENR
jgi:7,8-dihydro-6-hydroxymethylpterin dimethyltransferase